MTNYVWTGSVSTDWNDPANWVIAGTSTVASVVPTSGDNVTIESTGALVTVSGSGSFQSASLTIIGPVDLNGSNGSYSMGALSVTGALQLQGYLYDAGAANFANGASLQGGVTSISGPATFGTAFTLDGAELDLPTTSMTNLTLEGASTLSGEITLVNILASGNPSLTLGTGSLTVANTPPNLASLTIGGVQTLNGTFSASNVTVLGGAALYLNQGDSLTTNSATFQPSGQVYLDAGGILVNGNASFGSSLNVSGAGSFTVTGTLSTFNGNISASGSSRVELGQLDGTSGGLQLSTDSTSTIEIGGQNIGTAGAITIDAGVTFTESGTFSAAVIADYGKIIVAPNASLDLSGSTRGLTGTGSVYIEGGSTLTLNGVDPGTSDQTSLLFDQPGGELAITSADLNALGDFIPTIAGFNATDAIDFSGSVTSGSYAVTVNPATSQTQGVLTLFDGQNAVAYLNIGLGYSTAAGAFSVVPVNSSTTQIDYVGGGANPAPGPTPSPASFVWTGAVAGYWNNPSNWSGDPGYAPGSDDAVTVNPAANGAVQVLVGNGDASTLTLNGSSLLVGTFDVGALTVAPNVEAYVYAGSAINDTGDATFGYNYDSGITLNGGQLTVGGTLYGSYDPYTTGFVIENTGAKLQAGALVDVFYTIYSISNGGSLAVTQNVSNSGSYSQFYLTDGTFTVGGTFVSSGDIIAATASSQVQLTALQEDVNGNGVGLAVDATSSIEIGSAGGVAAGTITIDSGVTVTEQGNWTAPEIVDEGTLKVGPGQSLGLSGGLEVDSAVEVGAGATLSVNGSLTGSGVVTLSAGSSLSLSSDANGPTVSVAFSGAGERLGLQTFNSTPSNIFFPGISGFGSGDVIDIYDYGANITGAHYAGGELDLYSGSTVVATLSIGSGYTDAFSTLSIGVFATQINYLGGLPNPAPAGTPTADSYVWTGPVAGDWNATANWDDTTAGQNPANVAPGANDSVTIDAAANGAAQVIVGDGDAYGLTIEGETLLEGAFNIGAGGLTETAGPLVLYSGSGLTVSGDATFGVYTGLTLDGATMSASGTFYAGWTYGVSGQYLVENGGTLSVAALVGGGYYATQYVLSSGGTLTVTGNVSDNSTNSTTSIFSLDDSAFTVGGTFVSSGDSVSASDNSHVQFAALQEDVDGNGVRLAVDATSSIEIGSAGGAAAGTITIDAGQTVTEAGSFNAPTIVDDGTLKVGSNQSLSLDGALEVDDAVEVGAGATLSTDAITGAGTVTIDSGGTLKISGDASGSNLPIVFNGLGSVLQLDTTDLNASNALAPTIAGFGSTDVLDFSYGTVTNASYVQNIASSTLTNGVLTLYSGATVVANLTLTTNGSGYSTAANAFSVIPVNGFTTQIDYVGAPPASAPAGQNGHTFVWANAPVVGRWADLTNWEDTTTGVTSSAPGQNDIVTIDGAANGEVQVVVGNGDAYGMTLLGSTDLIGSFNIGGTGANGGLTVTAGPLVLYSDSGLTDSGDATFGTYTGLTLDGATMSASGTFYAGWTYGASGQYLVENGGTLSVGALVGGGYYATQYVLSSGGTLTVTGNVSDSSGNSSFSLDDSAFTVGGTFVSSGDQVYATSSSHVQLAALQEDVGGRGVSLSADSTSSIEIGTAGGAVAGTITIDSGVTVTESYGWSAPEIVDKGTMKVGPNQSLSLSGALEVDGGVEVGADAILSQGGGITGSGTVTIDAGATFAISSDASGSNLPIVFNGSGGVLQLDPTDLNASNAFAPTIVGFISGETIGFTDYSTAITSASDSGGSLNLFSGATEVASLDLAGNYSADSFSVTSKSSYNYQIVLTTPVPIAPPTLDDPSIVNGYVNTANDTAAQALSGLAQAGSTIRVYLNGATTPAYSTTANAVTGAWSVTIGHLANGSYSFVATAQDASGDISAQSNTLDVLVDAAPPPPPTIQNILDAQNSNYDSGFSVTAGAAVTATVNGASLSPAAFAVDFTKTTAGGFDSYVANSDAFVGTETITVVATVSDLAGNTSTSTLTLAHPIDTTPPAAPSISALTYAGHWNLSGSAEPGSTVTLYDGTTRLGTTTANGSGVWGSYATTETNAAIQTFTATATDAAGNVSALSGEYIEGTAGNDTFSFAAEPALSAVALLNGGAGTNTLMMTGPTTLTDGDFAHMQSLEVLGLTGASTVTLGSNAKTAGVATLNGAGTGAGNLLSLAGSIAETITGLTGNLNASGDSGALTVTATGTAPQTIVAGTGNISITDSAAAGGETIDTTQLGSGQPTLGTLTLAGTAPETVNNLAGNLVATSLSGALTVTTVGTGQTVTTGTGATSLTDNAGALTVNATATGAGKVLTLAGAALETVTGLGANIAAGGLSGALTVTTKTTSLTIGTGSGQTTVNANLVAGQTLTLTGSGGATVNTLAGNLTATSESGPLSVTTSGAAQTVTTGTGSISIADGSTGLLTINAAALAPASALTLTGSGAVTVTGLRGGLNASGDSGALTVTATGTAPQTIVAGSGKDTITAAQGGDTIEAGAGADTFNVTGHTVTDSFLYASATDSLNTGTANDTITGFKVGGSLNDLLNFSTLNPSLAIEGTISAGVVNADSIGWLYSGGNAMVYVNDTSMALATSSASLMEISLKGLSSGLSGTSNFVV